MRQRATVLFAVGVALLLGSYVLYTQRVVSRLRAEAAREGRMYGRIYSAIRDTSTDPMSVVLELASHVRESGVPMVVTDPAGNPTSSANTPYDGSPDDPGLKQFAAELDRLNPPVVEPNVGTIHFGHSPLVRELRVVPVLQAAVLALVLLAGLWAFRSRATADRERVWAGMARESAHQLGTPLSSLSGWIELLRDREADELTTRALDHMEGDLERLQRVAHRFERIGRPPQRAAVDLGVVATRVADYFRARVPSLAHAVTIETAIVDGGAPVQGDEVLLEWAVEALVKNAIDALAGRGGKVRIKVARNPEAVRLLVSDNGPGVPRELRDRIFDAGFSTKERGWGLGLALTRRIVEETHNGRLTLVNPERGGGAKFQIIFPA
ncbi:MAG: sensor histidine kinase [Gemmatimonadota bacterium]